MRHEGLHSNCLLIRLRLRAGGITVPAYAAAKHGVLGVVSRLDLTHSGVTSLTPFLSDRPRP